MMKKIVLAAIVPVLCILAACSADKQPAAETETAAEIISAPWFEQSADGEVLTVRLEGNATTGYMWSFEISDPEILELITEEYVPDQVAEGVVGAGGMWNASFKPTFNKDGEVRLTLQYGRSWEQQPLYIKTIDMKVTGRKITVTGYNAMEKELPLIQNGEYEVSLNADSMRKDGDVITAELTENKPVVLSDEEVAALKVGSALDLSAYGLDSMPVDRLNKRDSGSIEINDGATLVKDTKLGGWKIVVEDDDVISYPVSLGQATFDKNTVFIDELSRIAYDDANKYADIYDCVQNYRNVNTVIKLENGHVKEVKVLYHP